MMHVATTLLVLSLVTAVGAKRARMKNDNGIGKDRIETRWNHEYMECPACSAFANEVDVWSSASKERPYVGSFKFQEEKEEWIKEKSISRVANDFAFVVQEQGSDEYEKSGQFIPYSLLRDLGSSSNKKSETELKELDKYPFIGLQTFLEDLADKQEELILKLIASDAPYSIFFNRVCAGIGNEYSKPMCPPINDEMDSDFRYSL